MLTSRLLLRVSPIGWLVVGLSAVTVLAATLWERTNLLHEWMPNISTEAASLALTIAVVDRLISNRRRGEQRERVAQALRRVAGPLHALADYVLWDYDDMHPGESYQRPPRELRALLTHWTDGLLTRETPWPDSPRILTASQSIAITLEQQIQRHERVLEHDFVAESYRYVRLEGISRNMYLDQRPHEDSWKVTALTGIAREITTLLDAFEPYARRYLGRDWSVTLSREAIDYSELVRRGT